MNQWIKDFQKMYALVNSAFLLIRPKVGLFYVRPFKSSAYRLLEFVLQVLGTLVFDLWVIRPLGLLWFGLLSFHHSSPPTPGRIRNRNGLRLGIRQTNTWKKKMAAWTGKDLGRNFGKEDLDLYPLKGTEISFSSSRQVSSRFSLIPSKILFYSSLKYQFHSDFLPGSC